jgi:hypothetical protein
MTFSYLPPYGYACCPCCTAEFNLAAAVPTMLEKAPHNDTIVYMMCPKCHAAYQAATEPTRKFMQNKCFTNFKITGVKPDGSIHPWAITTTLTLELNDFDPVAAHENGHGLTFDIYLGVCKGTHDLGVFPGGLRIVTEKSASRGDV